MLADVSRMSSKTRWLNCSSVSPIGRDLDPPAEPDEQRLVEFFLEQQDLPADRRLRDVQPRARGRERAAVRDRPEDFELSQIHRAVLVSLRATC